MARKLFSTRVDENSVGSVAWRTCFSFFVYATDLLCFSFHDLNLSCLLPLLRLARLEEFSSLNDIERGDRSDVDYDVFTNAVSANLPIAQPLKHEDKLTTSRVMFNTKLVTQNFY